MFMVLGSTWSRGQAWGIYGFANSMCIHCVSARHISCLPIVYYHTKMSDFLETSRRMASYFLDNIPEDGIVPW